MTTRMHLDGFSVVYQPIVDLRDDSVVAVEALVRSAGAGMAGATAALVERAEADGTIHALGRAVLGRACEDAAAWSAARPSAPRLLVNLSALQLHARPFVDAVVETLRRTGLDAHQLVFELTESHPVTPKVALGLASLAGVGVGVALDDFGSGFGSLDDLRVLPLTGVKIDKRFVARLPDPVDLAFVKAIKGLADARGLWCIVEGIETRLQRRVVESLGLVYGQGFGLSRPMEAAGVERLLKQHTFETSRPLPAAENGSARHIG